MAFTIKAKKGDTLNKIANRFGFRNFRDAGVKSVQSGNFDKIGIGEEITLENYNPNKVQTSSSATPPVISSKDNAQAFNENKSKLDGILAGVQPEGEKPEIPATDVPIDAPAKEVTTEESIIDDPLFTKSRSDDKAKIDTATINMQADKTDYISSINTRLADVDAVTASVINRITATADKRINEQIRINTINTDRVKAYGVGDGGGIYKPIQFSDAITERERKGAEKVNELERARDTAIAEAMTASRLGKSSILSEKMEAIADIEDRLRSTLQDIEKESEDQYTLLRKLRKEKEAEDKEAREKIIKNLIAFASLNKEDFKDLTPEETEAKIAEIMRLSNLSYSEAYNAIIEGTQTDIKEKKTEAEIKKIEAQTETERAKAEKTRKETEEIGEEDDDITSSQNQKLENAGLGDADRKQKLDFLHGLAKGDATLYDEDDYARNADIGDIVVIGGQKYKKVAEDDYDLVE